jgi:hypothetical protein
MKKLVQALFILFSLAALGIAIYYFVEARAAAAEANKPLAMRKLVLGQDTAGSDPAGAKAGRESSLNKIAALPNEVILDTVSANLDSDEVDEQILTVRKTDKPGDHLSIVVADYSQSRRSWVRAFEGETLATKFTTFQIQTQDLIGDHNLDIVCSGMDDANEQTLTVYRRVKSGEADLISFAPIAAIAADSIVVDSVDRSEGYQLGQTNGVSWPIFAFQRDKSSENILDQIKTLYAWDPRSSAYVASGAEKIPGAQVEKEMATKILTGVEKDFEGFLQGAWCESGKSPTDPTARILVFDRPGNSIIFYSPDSQEDFDWNESHSTRYGLYVSCQNESVSDLRRLMDLELTGMGTISVRIFEDLQMKVDAQTSWDGSYRKMPPQSSSDAAAPDRAAPEIKLAGRYKGADGLSLSFDKEGFTLENKGRTSKGGFVLYTLGKDSVLQLSTLQDPGILVDRRNYRLRYSETKVGKLIIRHILLSPARATIEGLELLQEPELALEQR